MESEKSPRFKSSLRDLESLLQKRRKLKMSCKEEIPGYLCSVRLARDEWDTVFLSLVPQLFSGGRATIEQHTGQDITQLNICPAKRARAFSAKAKILK